MAILFSGQTGNWTAAGTWRVVDATSYLNSEAASTATTTGFVSSSAFTPGAITVEGIGVKIASRTASPTGTFSIRLAIAGVAVAGTTVTINATDVPAVTSTGNFWLYMKFAAPVLLLAATAYTLQVTSSVAGTVTIARNATAANWSRALLTTTTAAPAATDTMLISGEHTAAATNAVYDITMDNTAATIFGTIANNAIEIGAKGTLKYGTAASTAYQLNLNGDVNVGGFGELWIGDRSSKMPSTSSGLFKFTPASADQCQLNLRFGHVFKTGGADKLRRETLGANAIVGATTLTTTTSTGWLNNDNICIAPTTASTTAFDQRTLNANAVGTSITISAGLTNAKTIHAGTQVEIINLTSNVRIEGTSNANYCIHRYDGESFVDIVNTEFRFCVLSNAVLVLTATSTFTMEGSSMWDVTTLNAISIGTPTSGFIFIVRDCVFHNFAAVCGSVSNNGSNAANNLWEDVWAIRGLSGTNGLWFFAASTCATFTRCRAIGGGNGGWTIGNNATFDVGPIIMTDCVTKCNTIGLSMGLAYTSLLTHVITGHKSYLNSQIGISLGLTNNFTFTNATCFSNAAAGYNVQLNGTSNITLNDCTFYGGPTNASGSGVNIVTPNGDSNQFNNCTFGVGTTHSVGDIRCGTTQLQDAILTFNNCLFSSATEFALQTNLGVRSRIISNRHDQTDGNNRLWNRYGTIQNDNAVVRITGNTTQRLTPLNATYKLISGFRNVAVADGEQITVSVWVRKSVIGDGAAYNGTQPRLMLKGNPAVTSGNADTVLDTMTAATGTWELLTGILPVAIDNSAYRLFIDCDGTTGWVNVDNWKISKTHQTSRNKYWQDGAPVSWVQGNQGAGIFNF